jgi:thioredoxin-related protein
MYMDVDKKEDCIYCELFGRESCDTHCNDDIKELIEQFKKLNCNGSNTNTNNFVHIYNNLKSGDIAMKL